MENRRHKYGSDEHGLHLSSEGPDESFAFVADLSVITSEILERLLSINLYGEPTPLVHASPRSTPRQSFLLVSKPPPQLSRSSLELARNNVRRKGQETYRTVRIPTKIRRPYWVLHGKPKKTFVGATNSLVPGRLALERDPPLAESGAQSPRRRVSREIDDVLDVTLPVCKEAFFGHSAREQRRHDRVVRRKDSVDCDGDV